MKIAFKIIAICVWLALIVLFSVYCNDWFSDFINFIERKVVRVEVPPEVDFVVNVVPWNCFISFLICLPILFVKNRRTNVFREIGNVIVFFFFLLAWNIFAIVNLWIFFPESIGSYSATPAFSEVKSYALNDGWTPFQFWFAWCAFIILSNAFSMAMAFSISLSQKSKKPLILS
jgi:hypothetical protein